MKTLKTLKKKKRWRLLWGFESWGSAVSLWCSVPEWCYSTSLRSGTCKVFIFSIYCHAVHCARHFYYTVATFFNLSFASVSLFFFHLIKCSLSRTVTGDLNLWILIVFMKCFNEGKPLHDGLVQEKEYCAMTDENRRHFSWRVTLSVAALSQSDEAWNNYSRRLLKQFNVFCNWGSRACFFLTIQVYLLRICISEK